jgi:hypothetical protein
MQNVKKNNCQLKLLFVIFTISFFLLSSSTAYSAVKYYYYLQVGSFQKTQDAKHLDEKLRKVKENTIIRGEKISGLGYSYRVYLGPFSSWQGASSKLLELTKKGIFFDHTYIKKKKSTIQSNLKKQPERTVKYYYYLQVGSFRKAQDAKHLAEKLRNVNENTIIRGEEISGLGYRYCVYLGSFSSWQGANSKLLELTMEGIFFEHTYIQKKKSPIQSNLKEKPEIAEKRAKKMQRGHGRNIPRSNIALGLNHTYIEVQTEVTKRTQITFDGTTTDIQDIPLGTIDKNEYPTSMHIDTIRVRFGLTDYMEIFADIGLDYDEDFDPGIVYGGGTRLNLYKKTGQSFGEFYIAFQGEYLTGTLTKEYKSSAGSMWGLEADWQWLTGGMELGVVHSWVAAYVGGVYFYYREDTERSQLEDIPPPYTSFVYQDELEEEYNYGVYGGVGFHFSPAILLNIEGQFINQKSVSLALEYHF